MMLTLTLAAETSESMLDRGPVVCLRLNTLSTRTLPLRAAATCSMASSGSGSGSAVRSLASMGCDLECRLKRDIPRWRLVSDVVELGVFTVELEEVVAEVLL